MKEYKTQFFPFYIIWLKIKKKSQYGLKNLCVRAELPLQVIKLLITHMSVADFNSDSWKKVPKFEKTILNNLYSDEVFERIFSEMKNR